MSIHSHNRRGRAWWKTLRIRVFERDGYRCRLCNYDDELSVDHIKSVGKGGPEKDINNLQTLCSKCHQLKDKAEHYTANYRHICLITDGQLKRYFAKKHMF